LFRFFHKIVCKTRRQIKAIFDEANSSKLRRRNNGQVAIVLILMAAIALIFYTVVFNLGRVAEIKTTTTVAANVSAALMASYWASYTEQLFQVQLGGEKETGSDLTVCGMGSIWTILIGIVVIIIGIVLCATGYGCAAGAYIIAIAIVSLTLAVAALLLQVLVLDPGLTAAWNKMMQNLTTVDQFVERGITSALQNSVNDPVREPDLHDMNMNGLFGFDAAGVPKDEVSRFGMYYTRRLQKINVFGSSAIAKFRTALQNFMDWFWAPVDCSTNPTHPCCGPTPPTECNPCCQPSTQLPACCDGADLNFPSCGDSANCTTSSTYGTAYPAKYDPFYEDFSSGASSFRGLFGVDDENRFFHTSPLRSIANPQVPETDTQLDSDGVVRNIFRFDDAQGNVFPMLWRFSDWGVDLGRLTLDPSNNYKKYECHMCDPNYPPGYPQCTDISAVLSAPVSFASFQTVSGGLSYQLRLPFAPGQYNGGNCVYDPRDPRDIKWNLVRPDVVRTIEDLIVFPESKYGTDCGQCGPSTTLCGTSTPFVGKWKRGADRYCTSVYPYYIGCPKAGGMGCPPDSDTGSTACTYPCGDSRAQPPAAWPDDAFDDFVYQGKDFIFWAEGLLEGDVTQLTSTFRSWYPSFATWLAPKAIGDPLRDPFLNGAQDGQFLQWRAWIQIWRDKADAWLNTTYASPDCNVALCLPIPRTGIPPGWVGTPPGQCAGLKQSEENYTYKDGSGVLAVVNCLTYNIDHLPEFAACAADCNKTNCTDLPRSLLVNDVGGPDYFDTNDFVVPTDSSSGSCGAADFATNWKPKLLKSAAEAENQRVKLIKRRDFLAARVKEMQNFKALLDSAIAQMDVLINTANSVIDERVQIEDPNNQPQQPLPSFAIYGWQTNSLGSNSHQWHIVRVDVRSPQRCANNCGKDGKLEPDLPTIKTYTKGFLGLKRCFSLGDAFGKPGCDDEDNYNDPDKCFLGGTVKARVVRWDEDKNPLYFPNLLSLWRFTFHHPLVASGVPSANGLESICPSMPSGEAPGAFMLNHAPGNGDPPEYQLCWDKVNAILEHGVMSQACAQYYYHQRTPRGFDLKFAPCTGPF